MSYVKTQWVNNTTPINDTNLNKIEQGIYDNSLVVDAVTDKLNPTDTETYKIAELTEGQITDVIGVNDILIKGDTEQDGTPTPDSPVDVNVVSGSNVVNTSNKNLYIPLLNIGEIPILMNAGTVSLLKDEYIFTATGNDMYFGRVRSAGGVYSNDCGPKIYVNNNTKISFYITNTILNNTYITAYNSEGVSLGFTSIVSNRGTYTVPENCDFITFRMGKGNPTVGMVYKTKVMIVYGDTIPTTYEPHQGKELLLDLPVENLFGGTLEQGGFDSNGLNGSNSKRIRSQNYTEVKENQIYTISTTEYNTTKGTILIGISFYTENDYSTARILESGWNSLPYTFTIPQNCKFIRFIFRITSSLGDSLIVDTDVNNVQLEQGSKANAYTPYGTTPIELCKIGNYQDYFYKSGSKWYLHKEIGKAIFNGDESWSYSASNLVFYTDVLTLSRTNSNLFCNRFLKVNNSTTYANMNTGEIKYDGLGSKRIIIKYTDITSAADFKTWLASNNTKVYYPLETATDTEITDTTLISQLEAIYNAPLYEETNITQTNNDLPMVLDITACKDNINGIKAWIRR